MFRMKSLLALLLVVMIKRHATSTTSASSMNFEQMEHLLSQYDALISVIKSRTSEARISSTSTSSNLEPTTIPQNDYAVIPTTATTFMTQTHFTGHILAQQGNKIEDIEFDAVIDSNKHLESLKVSTLLQIPIPTSMPVTRTDANFYDQMGMIKRKAKRKHEAHVDWTSDDEEDEHKQKDRHCPKRSLDVQVRKGKGKIKQKTENRRQDSDCKTGTDTDTELKDGRKRQDRSEKRPIHNKTEKTIKHKAHKARQSNQKPAKVKRKKKFDLVVTNHELELIEPRYFTDASDIEDIKHSVGKQRTVTKKLKNRQSSEEPEQNKIKKQTDGKKNTEQAKKNNRKHRHKTKASPPKAKKKVKTSQQVKPVNKHKYKSLATKECLEVATELIEPELMATRVDEYGQDIVKTHGPHDNVANIVQSGACCTKYAETKTKLITQISVVPIHLTEFRTFTDTIVMPHTVVVTDVKYEPYPVTTTEVDTLYLIKPTSGPEACAQAGGCGCELGSNGMLLPGGQLPRGIFATPINEVDRSKYDIIGYAGRNAVNNMQPAPLLQQPIANF